MNSIRKKLFFALDADFLIKTGLPLSDTGQSQLSEVLSLAGASYIHEDVLEEVDRQCPERQHIDELIEAGLIWVWSDKMLLEFLLLLFKDEETACKRYIKILDDTIKSFSSKKTVKSLGELYLLITNVNHKNFNYILENMECIGKPRDLNIGELKTSIMVNILRMVNNEKNKEQITLFASDDRKASLMMQNVTKHKVQAISYMGSFIYLYHGGTDYQTALLYLKQFLKKSGLTEDSSFRLLDQKNNLTIESTYKRRRQTKV